jgi:uncharacterized protein YlxW (UPF0749 family)
VSAHGRHDAGHRHEPVSGPQTRADRPAADAAEPRRRLLRSLVPRGSRGELLAGLLCAVLGFALVVQVRQTQEADLGSLRDSDLVRILDDLGERNERLDSEEAELSRVRSELESGTSARAAAQEAARRQVDALGILAGTAAAEGPGLSLVLTDPDGVLSAAQLLDAVQELRDSGAEAMQVGGVRIVASTSFTDTADGIEVDGTLLEQPYEFVVIGDPPTLETALEIPGGVVETATSRGALVRTTQREEVVVDALRTPQTPQYARPAEPTATP